MSGNHFNHFFYISLQRWTKQTTFALIISLFCLGAYAQTDTTSIKRKPQVVKLIKEGFVSLNGKDGNTKNPQLAFSKFKEGANLGDNFCQLVLASLYEKGIGTKSDTEEAKKWYTSSAENGNPTAILTLGTFYKSGKYGSIDFKNAIKWFEKGANLNHPNALYAMGYMYMKGFGVRQNYTKGVEYLKKSITHNNTSGCQLLGYCFENGYGIEKNKDEANRLYQYAADKGCKQSKIRLEKISQGGLKTAHVQSPGFSVLTKKHTPVYFENKGINLDGEKEGTLIVYDWSGQFIEEQYDVKFNFQNNKIKIKQDQREFAGQEYKNEGNAIFTNKLQINRPDPQGGDRLWTISSLIFKTEQVGADSYLIGDVILFSDELKEPGPRAYIVFNPTNSKKIFKDIATRNKEESVNLSGCRIKAYPNPYIQELHVVIELEQPGIINLQITNALGQVVKKVKTETYFDHGKHYFTVNDDFPRGVYYITLMTKKSVQSLSIIKN